MIKLMGPGSGIKGPVLGFLLGSFAAGLVRGLSLRGHVMKKGASLSNILISMGLGPPQDTMLHFEISAMGARFALRAWPRHRRHHPDSPGIQAAIPKDEIEKLYKNAEVMD
jgi:hypothetical protein